MNQTQVLRYRFYRIAAIFIPFLFLLLTEIAFRISMPGLRAGADRVRFLANEDRQRRFSILKVPDPVLLWHLKPYSPLMNHERLNRYGYRTPNFKTRKPEDCFRIVIIGDSRSFGFGIADRKYLFSDQLRNTLSEKSAGKVEVINLAVIGYSSYQGLKLLDEFVWKIKPDLLISWFGFNDTLYYHVTDRQSAVASRYFGTLQNFLNHSFFYQWLRSIYIDLFRRKDAPIPVNQPITRRVPLDEYHLYMTEICRAAQHAGCEILCMNSPIRSDVPMILNAKRIVYQDQDGRYYQKLQNQYDLEGYWLMNATAFPGSEDELDILLQKYPELPILHYFKGRFLREKNLMDEAEIFFDNAKNLDTQRKAISEYNDALKKVCNTLDVECINLVETFYENESRPLFVDDCHPNVKGHKLIYETLLPVIREKLPDGTQ